MTDAAMDNQALLRRTLLTTGAMVGACVLVVGTLTLLAVAIVGHAVASPDRADAVDGGAAPALTARAKIGNAPPPPSAITRTSKP